jgi:hypothetical protein
VYFTHLHLGVAVLLGRVPEDARRTHWADGGHKQQPAPNAAAIPAATGVAPSSTRGRSSAAAAEKRCLVATSGPCDVVAAGLDGGACIICLTHLRSSLSAACQRQPISTHRVGNRMSRRGAPRANIASQRHWGSGLLKMFFALGERSTRGKRGLGLCCGHPEYSTLRSSHARVPRSRLSAERRWLCLIDWDSPRTPLV